MRDIYQKFRAALRAHTLAKVFVQAVSWLGMVYVLRTLDAHAVGVFAIASMALELCLAHVRGRHARGARAAVTRSRCDERRSVFSLLLAMRRELGRCCSWRSRTRSRRWWRRRKFHPSLWCWLPVSSPSPLGILPHARLIHEMRFGPLAVISSIQALVGSHRDRDARAGRARAPGRSCGARSRASLARILMLNIAVPSLHLPTRSLIAIAFRYLRTSSDPDRRRLAVPLVHVDRYSSCSGAGAGTTQLGFFSFGQQVANTPLEKISTVVNDVSLPAYARLAADRTRGRPTSCSRPCVRTRHDRPADFLGPRERRRHRGAADLRRAMVARGVSAGRHGRGGADASHRQRGDARR